MWVKGQSGNPGGKPPLTIELREVRKLAQERTPRAFEVIAELMENAEKDAVRLAAAIAVLKIAGMPMSADVNVTVNRESPRLPSVSTAELQVAAGTPQGTMQ